MKYLNQFISFDWNRFAEGKTFLVTGVSEWVDYDSKSHLGTKVEVVILADNTKYEFKNGDRSTNRFEKLTFKINKDLEIPMDSKVVPRGVTASVYGEYRNLLSVKCTDINVMRIQFSNTIAPRLSFVLLAWEPSLFRFLLAQSNFRLMHF